MVSQSSYPSSWARDCPSKGIRIEVGVYDIPDDGIDDFSDVSFDWIEFPTSEVEFWEEKADGPHIKKTAKVVFPSTFDGADVRSLVKNYGISAPSYARLWVKDENDNWVLDHCGIVAGVGPTNNTLESKCWVYDMSYFFEAIPVTQSYSMPTARDVIRDVANYLQTNLIPLTGVAILPPNGETVFLRTSQQLADDSVAPRTGSSYYGYDVSEEDNELGDASIEDISINTGPTFDSLPLVAASPALLGGVQISDAIEEETGLDNIDALVSPLFGLDNIVNSFEDATGIDVQQRTLQWLYNFTELGQKEFTGNHDTVRDVMNWLTERTGLQYHFEPTRNGVVLVITGGPMRRTFVQDAVLSDVRDGVIEPTEFQSVAPDIPLDVGVNDFADPAYFAHETVTVRNNDALFEIAPANRVVVKGDTRRSLMEGNVGIDGFQESVPKFFEDQKYPVAEATAGPLVTAAGGEELTIEIESDASTIDEVKQQAVVALQDHLDETSEGDITLDGMPRALPYDVIDAYETCDRYAIDQLPVRYEIETVKHTDSMTSTLETELNVQAFVGDEAISVETSEETL